MPDESRHESADLQDYSVQEPADSLTGSPGEAGDNPLDRGVVPPDRWSAGHGTRAVRSDGSAPSRSSDSFEGRVELADRALVTPLGRFRKAVLRRNPCLFAENVC